MASFIVKQMVGDKLGAAKGAMGGGEKKEEGSGMTEEEEQALEEQKREAEMKRQEKHRQMEAEREDMRQGIRDKYNIKKKEEPSEPQEDPALAGRLGRAKKSPAELEAEGDEDEEGGFPTDLEGAKKFVGDMQGKITSSVSDAKEKCSVM